jgi:hypothetical protein
MARKAESIPVLAENGLLAQGTVIEVMPEVRAEGVPAGDARFRAQILNAQGGAGAVRWEHDGQAYSLTELTNMLWEEHGLGLKWPNYILKNWRIVGHNQSMWDEAEQFTR